MDINSSQKTRLMPKIEAYFNSDLSGKTIAIWGLAFKPNTDDIREAPALYNIDALLSQGAKVQAYDPEAMENVKAIYGDKITFCEDQYSALEGADALLIVTEWPVFRTPDFETIKSRLSNSAIFDGRNLYDTKHMEELGFDYFSIGRKEITNG
jgi:UDPglucose 6-dehydrogenase